MGGDKKKRETHDSRAPPVRMLCVLKGLALRCVVARFCPTYDQFATKEFLVVQFVDRSLGLVDRLHLHEGKPFRSLIMAVTDDFRVLDMTNPIKQVEQVALRGVE